MTREIKPDESLVALARRLSREPTLAEANNWKTTQHLRDVSDEFRFGYEPYRNWRDAVSPPPDKVFEICSEAMQVKLLSVLVAAFRQQPMDGLYHEVLEVFGIRDSLGCHLACTIPTSSSAIEALGLYDVCADAILDVWSDVKSEDEVLKFLWWLILESQEWESLRKKHLEGTGSIKSTVS